MKLNNFSKFVKEHNYIILGIIIVVLAYISCLFIGEDIWVNVHDQLDSEVPYYVLRSRSLSTLFQTNFQQFMDGNAEVSVASFGTLFFYLWLKPLYAFITNLYFVRLIAFISMNVVLRKNNVEAQLAFLVAIVFSFIPFYSVYGLSVMGVSLVIDAIYNIKSNKLLVGYFEIAFYSLFSSLVLIGYAILWLGGCYFLYCLLIEKRDALKIFIACCEMLFFYILENIGLLKSVIMGNGGFVSHKAGYVLSPRPLLKSVMEIFIVGQEHAVSLNRYIIIVFAVAIIVLLISRKNHEIGTTIKAKKLLKIMLYIVIISCFYGLFSSRFGVQLRNEMFKDSPLKAFQFHRFFWIMPTLWYMLFGLSLSIIFNSLKNKKYCYCLVVVSFILPAMFVIKESDLLKSYLSVINNSEVESQTWEKAYAEDLFDDISKYIGKKKHTYRVVSIGIHPNIALYNGFYCLDGYSQNYNLKYKNEFGKMMESEFAKNDEIYHYFWDWGNRCYVYPAELHRNCTIGKNNTENIELNIDMNQLSQMGCEYIISTVKIKNANELGIVIGGYFESEQSFYGLYLYEVVR